MKLIKFLKKLNRHKILLKRNLFIFIGLFIFWVVIYPFTPINVTENNATFKINSGSNLNQITNQLVETELLNDSIRFKILTLLTGNHTKLKKGYYKIPENTTPLGLLNILVDGKEILFSITFVEGSTFTQIIKQINRNKNLKKTLKGLSEKEILK